jgi:hypothetical protein
MPGENVNDILTHCFIAVGSGAGKKSIDFDAVVWLRGYFMPLFEKNIAQHDLKWGNGNPAVLKAAKKLGQIAAKKAGSALRINQQNAEAAAKEVQIICKAAAEAGKDRQVQGIFCDP